MSQRAAGGSGSILARFRLRERIRDRDQAVYGILIIAAVLFPLVTIYATDGTALVSQATRAGYFVLLAIGLNVVVGFAGLLDLGYAAFFAIGAYTYALLASPQLASSPAHHAVHLPFWLMLFVAMFVAAAAGAILGFPTLRLRGDYLAIVTLGFGEIVPQLFYNFDQWTGGINAVGIIDQPVLPAWIQGPWSGDGPVQIVRSFNFGGDPVAFYVLICILIAAAVILVSNLYRSRLGRAWMAIREDEDVAQAIGINLVMTKLLAYGIGGAMGGIGGAIFAVMLGSVFPHSFQLLISINVLVLIILGGMGSIWGVIVGALVLVGLPELLREFGEFRFLIYGIVLVVMMLYRPEGLLPGAAQRLELRVEEAGAPDASLAGGS